MKIQCPCGTKLAFEITPDMATTPVSFVCPVCGLDSSVMVNEIVRQELGVADTTAPAPAPVATITLPVTQPAPAPAPAPAPMRIARPTGAPAPAPAPVPIPVPSAAAKPAMRIATHAPAAAHAHTPASAAGAAGDNKFCLKHPNQEIVHQCRVCAKPMCPDCMALFGYVCSPRCRGNAESRGVDIPVYALQKSVIEAAKWKKVSRIAGSIGAVIVLILGFWFWYAWFGCTPKVAYAMRFEEKVKEGQVRLCGTNHLVFIRDGELGRIDMKSSTPDKPVWSKQLVDKSKFGPLADASIAASVKARERYIDEVGEASHFKIPSREDMIQGMFESAVGSMELHLAGENIWVLAEGKLTRFDWQTGAVGKELALEDTYGLQRKGDELVSDESDYEDPTVKIMRHINLLTGETSKETTQKPIPPRLMDLLVAASTNKPTKLAANNKTAAKTVAAATQKVVAANEARRPDAPLDPQKLADQAQKLPYAGKVALPVLIANARNQQRLFAEMAGTSDDEDSPRVRRQPSELELALAEWDASRVVQAADGPVQFSRVLLEQKTITREAMKAPPKKPALNENVSAGNSLDVAQDLLNEMQREAGSTVTENVSRYKVTVRRSGAGIPEWTGEVTGAPAFHPLKTMDIITAGTKAIAIDHSNKKLWEATLNFPVSGHSDLEELFDEATGASESGLGPCVEKDDAVFVYDQGSLAAFDRNTGEARWRLPSVGIAGLWFDDKGMLYVNTTTAGGDSIRYSKEVNLHDQPMTLILKVNPKTGKTLWDCQAAKHITYMWKKYIYTTDQFEGEDPEDGGMASITGMAVKPFLRIRRIDASNGRVVWTHVEERCPLDLHFHENSIQIMFKKEVQHLKILML